MPSDGLVHQRIIASFVERGRPPSLEELAEELGAPAGVVGDAGPHHREYSEQARVPAPERGVDRPGERLGARDGLGVARGRPSRGRADPRYSSSMCIICVELAKQAMTPSEARRALREMSGKLDKQHATEVETRLAQAEADPAATKP